MHDQFTTTAVAGSAKTLVGRDAELERLSAVLQTGLADRGGVVLLAGAAGIGKTYLTDALAQLAADQGAAVVWGRCREDAGAPAYWPWRQLLHNHWRDRPQRLSGLPPSPELAQLAPALFADSADAPLDGGGLDEDVRCR